MKTLMSKISYFKANHENAFIAILSIVYGLGGLLIADNLFGFTGGVVFLGSSEALLTVSFLVNTILIKSYEKKGKLFNRYCAFEEKVKDFFSGHTKKIRLFILTHTPIVRVLYNRKMAIENAKQRLEMIDLLVGFYEPYEDAPEEYLQMREEAKAELEIHEKFSQWDLLKHMLTPSMGQTMVAFCLVCALFVGAMILKAPSKWEPIALPAYATCEQNDPNLRPTWDDEVSPAHNVQEEYIVRSEHNPQVPVEVQLAPTPVPYT